MSASSPSTVSEQLRLPTPSGDDLAIARTLLTAITRRDELALLRLFAPDVWFRALVVREVLERHDALGAVAIYHGWFGRAEAFDVLGTSLAPAVSRSHLSYRVRLRPDWAPDVWHVIEQSGYVRVRDGRIARLDLVCTGFVPES
jgi:hypothetical protein